MLLRFLLSISILLGSPVALAEGFVFGKPANPESATRTVEIEMGEMYFKPAFVQIKAGETVRFVLKNVGNFPHEFSLGYTAMHREHREAMLRMQAEETLRDHGHGTHAHLAHAGPNTLVVEPGQVGELTWTFYQPDWLQFACNIHGHYQAGMIGQMEIMP
ncbi:plastocyanin/azurin family copper-binding protein [Pseudomonas sp.]|uniref:cupredoxin domain-containing protein n=1 Tax=Pseudomonas sp. TaxID=306 RepID=UPI001A0CE67B|nr:plastocyanin/azurin family copper-binding protein [Pseudomonas sp.]MBF0677134.1 cupredoxin domain-containing protein [Pseudomonas sp.]